ncbi:MAG: hypothetical protein E7540_02510 [Ruminococcaceae bacterium]|nr:hypothetical protein [Oscillospiraceae bacterium]
MLCEKCGKYAATTHIKTSINGKITEQNLCGYCAAKGGYTGFGSNSISNLLASMFGQSLQMSSGEEQVRCGCCGSSFEDIAKTGKVGCSMCYDEFGNKLIPYLKRIHGSVRHVGKTPGRKDLVVTNSNDPINELKAQLANLVAMENYEQAAVVRDEIKRLEGEK